MITQAIPFSITKEDLPDLEANYLAVKSTGALLFFRTLESVQELLDKYSKLVLVWPQQESYPISILQEFFYYNLRARKEGIVLHSLSEELPVAGTLYIVLSDSDLAALIKIARQANYIIGEDMGILSFGDAPIKKCLSISVIDTCIDDFDIKAGSYIAKQQQSAKSYTIILRNSF